MLFRKVVGPMTKHGNAIKEQDLKHAVCDVDQHFIDQQVLGGIAELIPEVSEIGFQNTTLIYVVFVCCIVQSNSYYMIRSAFMI